MLANRKLPEAEELDEAAFLRIIRGGKVLTINEDGISVIRTGKGGYVKLFRLPKLFSSDLYSPRPRRFVRAVEKLQEIGIPTVRNLRLYWIDCMNRHAVHYKRLKGKELRSQLQTGENRDLLIQHWIALMATLHENGIYFRGINFSNVLVTPDQELGLIDVGSTEFKPAPLSPAMRARNFKHPLAYQVDLNLFQEFGMTRLVESYLKRANLSDRDRDAFLAKAGTQHPELKSAIDALN